MLLIVTALPVFLILNRTSFDQSDEKGKNAASGNIFEIYSIRLGSDGEKEIKVLGSDVTEEMPFLKSNSFIQFRIAPPDPRLKFVSVFGLSETLEYFQYFPMTGRNSYEVRSGGGPQTLSPSVLIPPDYSGRLKIFCILSASPVSPDDMNRVINDWKGKKVSFNAIPGVDLSAFNRQANITLNVIK